MVIDLDGQPSLSGLPISIRAVDSQKVSGLSRPGSKLLRAARSDEGDGEQSARVSRENAAADAQPEARRAGFARNRTSNWNFEMYNNYFISPVRHSNSIYLTYQGDQPFASFGSKTLMPGVTGTFLPSAPPQDNIPRALVTEVLQLCPSRSIAPAAHLLRDETGPTDRRKSLYRSHKLSQYSMPDLDDHFFFWHEATVTFKGKRVPMLFQNDGLHGEFYDLNDNQQATTLIQQADTEIPAYFTHPLALVRRPTVIWYNAYLVLGQMWKPFADIRTTKYRRASDFGSEVGSLFEGWWHAVRVSNGWRLYADDINDLFHARMKFYS